MSQLPGCFWHAFGINVSEVAKCIWAACCQAAALNHLELTQTMYRIEVMHCFVSSTVCCQGYASAFM